MARIRSRFFAIGGLLQKFDRDTMKFAIKCSYVEIDGGNGRAVAKDPITDHGKRNKPGRLKLVKNERGEYSTLSSIDDAKNFDKADDQLVTIFENGELLHEYSLETIRAACDIDPRSLDSLETM